MLTTFQTYGKVPPTRLDPALSEAAQKAELYTTAALAMVRGRSRMALRRRVLSDDPELAAVPIGCRAGVIVAPIGRIRVTTQGVRGLFRLTAVPVAR